MTTKTRVDKQVYDLRSYISSVPSAPDPVIAFGSQVELESSVTAEYPKWDYKKVISNGDSATTALTGVRRRYRHLNQSSYTYKETLYTIIGTVQATRSQSLFGCFDAYGLSPYTGSDIFADVDNRALMGFNSKCLAAQTSLQAQVSLGELKESIGMIQDRSKKIANGIENYFSTLRKRRGRLSRAAIVKMLADSWLEYSFGWKPLVADIDGAAKALAKSQYQRPARQFVRFTASGNASQSGQPTSQSFAGNYTVTRISQRRKSEVFVKYYGIVDAPSDRNYILKQFGWTWDDFVPTVWELIPYSFLVDYFSNVGEIIQAFSYGSCGTRWVSRGIKTTSESAYQSIDVKFDGVAPWVKEAVETSLGKPSVLIEETVSRANYSGSRVPSLQFEIPGSSMKWLNIAALIASRDSTSRNLRI